MLLKREIIEDLGESGINFIKSLEYILQGKLNIGNTSVQIVQAGIGSLFIVSITAIFIGLAMSTHLAKELSIRFGAQNLVGGIIGMAFIREIGPIITSIVVAGRVGAAVSAEIGSMKTSEQIDALSVLGINPIQFLVTPRLVASAIVSPLLTVFSCFLAIISGMFVTNHMVNISYSEYLDSVRLFVTIKDVLVMMFKAIVFGGIISILANTTGLQVQGGAEAVGKAATKTVVWSIIWVFIVNYLITSLFYGI